MNKSIVEVLFKVKAKVKLGEEIRLSGNVPGLGCNNPERAIPLVTSPTDFPCWATKEALFLPGDVGVVKYRYCLFSGGLFKRWEGNDEFLRSLDFENNDGTVKTTTDIFGSLQAASNSVSDLISASSRHPPVLSTSDRRSFRARQFAEWGRKNLQPSNAANGGVILVSYFLPVILSKTNGVWSATWDQENVVSLQLDIRLTWVGTVRYSQVIEAEDEDAITAALLPLNCHPLFVDRRTHNQFYEVFCKSHLWPVLHHVADVYGPLKSSINAQAQQDVWFTYTTVNRLFRNKIFEVYHEGDIIWIHGFHLMLLPSYLRKDLTWAKIGMFFHTPFPSSEIWRTMNRREDLLRGVLSADQIGFHLYEYARHFLTCCRRQLGLRDDVSAAGVHIVRCDGRDIAISCIHVGVDLPRIEQSLKQSEVTVGAQAWKKKFPNRVIITGIDRLERLKGIPLKLLAIEQFMQENPQWVGKLVFLIIGISAGERAEDHKQTQKDVQILTARINSCFPSPDNTPLIYFEERQERAINIMARLALFAASDVLMVLYPRDGLNRSPIEFTLARARSGHLVHTDSSSTTQPLAGTCSPNEGLVIISEFVSSARVMRGSLVVNPYKIVEVKNAIKKALEMTCSERSDRMRRNLEFSQRLTTTAWATEVIKDIQAVEKSSDHAAYAAVGFGKGFRVMGIRSGFDQLDMTSTSRIYRNSQHRLILLDWGGTLVAEEKDDKLQLYAVAHGNAHRAGPTQAMKKLLEDLSADPKNTVFVVSGKEPRAVSEFFGDVKGLGLGAEHGFFYRWPGDDPSIVISSTGSLPTDWQTMTSIGDYQWKDAAKMVMDIYVQRTHGSYIEVKGNALIWQYRDADPEFGFLQSMELEANLTDVLSSIGTVNVLRGGGASDCYIEVRPVGISKGLFFRTCYCKTGI